MRPLDRIEPSGSALTFESGFQGQPMAGLAHQGISSALTSALLSFVHDAILLADADGRIVLASALAQKLIGRTQNDMVGVSLDDLLPGCLAACVADIPGPERAVAPTYVAQAMHLDGKLAQMEVALWRVPDGGVIAVALSIRHASDGTRAHADSALVRYDAFLDRISRFAGRSERAHDRIDGVAALIAAALGIRAVAIIVPDRGEEPEKHLHDFPDTIANALLRCFASQPREADPSRRVLADMNDRQQLFASAVRRGEFRDAVVVELSIPETRAGWLSALSKDAGRFDESALAFLDRAGALIVRALTR